MYNRKGVRQALFSSLFFIPYTDDNHDGLCALRTDVPEKQNPNEEIPITTTICDKHIKLLRNSLQRKFWNPSTWLKTPLSENQNEITAKALSQFQGKYLLLGLKEIEKSVAEALAIFKGKWIYLDELEELDADSSKALTQFKGNLSLRGLQKLNEFSAKMLALQKDTTLIFSNLKYLDEASAKELIQFQGSRIYLNAVETINKGTIETLAEFKGEAIHLEGLKAIDEATAKTVAQYEFNGPFCFSSEIYEQIEAYKTK